MGNNRSQERSNKITDLWWPVIENKSFDGIHQISRRPLSEDRNTAGLRNVVLRRQKFVKFEERRTF
jgi:hypothetical protein